MGLAAIPLQMQPEDGASRPGAGARLQPGQQSHSPAKSLQKQAAGLFRRSAVAELVGRRPTVPACGVALALARCGILAPPYTEV